MSLSAELQRVYRLAKRFDKGIATPEQLQIIRDFAAKCAPGDIPPRVADVLAGKRRPVVPRKPRGPRLSDVVTLCGAAAANTPNRGGGDGAGGSGIPFVSPPPAQPPGDAPPSPPPLPSDGPPPLDVENPERDPSQAPPPGEAPPTPPPPIDPEAAAIRKAAAEKIAGFAIVALNAAGAYAASQGIPHVPPAVYEFVRPAYVALAESLLPADMPEIQPGPIVAATSAPQLLAAAIAWRKARVAKRAEEAAKAPAPEPATPPPPPPESTPEPSAPPSPGETGMTLIGQRGLRF